MLFYAKKGLAGILLYMYYHNIIANTSPYWMYITTLAFIEYFLPEKITLTECKKWRQTQFPYTCIEALAIISSPISNVLVQYSLPSFPHESPNKTFHCLIQHITRYQTCIKRSLHTTTHIKNQTFVFKSSKLVFAYTLSNSVRFQKHTKEKKTKNTVYYKAWNW